MRIRESLHRIYKPACFTPVYMRIQNLISQGNLESALAQIKDPFSDLRRQSAKLLDRKKITGGIFPELGRRAQHYAFSPNAMVKAASYEAKVQSIRTEHPHVPLPHIATVARLIPAVLCTPLLFGTESGGGSLSSGIYLEEEAAPMTKSSEDSHKKGPFQPSGGYKKYNP